MTRLAYLIFLLPMAAFGQQVVGGGSGSGPTIAAGTNVSVTGAGCTGSGTCTISSSPITGATTNAIATAASGTTLQTICATCTLDSSGNMSISGNFVGAMITGNGLSISGSSTLAAASFSGTATFNGAEIANNGVNAAYNNSTCVFCTNTSASPAIYGTGLGGSSGGTLSLIVSGAGIANAQSDSFQIQPNKTLTFVDSSYSPAAGLSYLAYDTLALGYGAFGNSYGVLSLAAILDHGATFTTNSGCSETGIVGGATSGAFIAGASSCTTTITMGNSVTAPHAWWCGAANLTHPVNAMSETASTTTTVTLSGTVVSGDQIIFSCPRGF